MYKSTNGGVSWKAINGGLNHAPGYALAIDSTNQEILYVGSNDGGVLKFVTSAGSAKGVAAGSARSLTGCWWLLFAVLAGVGVFACWRNSQFKQKTIKMELNQP